MLPQSHRITRSTFPGRDVQRKQWNGTVLRCVFFPPFSPTHSVSVAVVVAKKYAKHATDRHIFKRRVFSVLSEQRFTSLLAQERVVVFPLRPLEQISFADIEEDIIQCLRAAPWKSAL